MHQVYHIGRFVKVLSTDYLKEVMQYKEVLIASNTEEFIELLDKALLLRNDPDYLKRVDELAKKNSWDSRASLILEFVSQRKPEKVSVEEIRYPHSRNTHGLEQ